MADETRYPPVSGDRHLIATLLVAGFLVTAALGYFTLQDRKAELAAQQPGGVKYDTPTGEARPASAPWVALDSYERIVLGVGVVGVLVALAGVGVYLSQRRRGGEVEPDNATVSATWNEYCRAVCAFCGEMGPLGRNEEAANHLARDQGFELLPGVGWRCAECHPVRAREVAPAPEGDGREVQAA